MSLTEWKALLTAVTENSAFQRGYSILEDLRDHRQPPSQLILEAWLQELAELASSVCPCRWAVVLRPDFVSLIDQGRAAADHMRVHQIDLRVFLDFKAALGWASRQEGILPAARS